jgi:TET-Associated Glycosyltransferase
MNPRWPIFIPSRGRASTAYAPRELDRIGVPFRLIVEDFEADEYAAIWGASRVLVLPQRYIDEYESGDPEGDEAGLPMGPGCPRNYAWDIAEAEGAAWHWCIDDNVRYWARMDGNHFFTAGDGWIFAAMEDFAARYSNVGGAAPEYNMHQPARNRWPRPFRINRRMMSTHLVRTCVPLRWRFRYNDDIDFSIRLLDAGWCIINYVAFTQGKLGTQHVPGGSTDTIYAGGTYRKTMLLVAAHPTIVKPVTRWGRPHHVVDWSRWEGMHPIRDPAVPIPATSPYPTKIVPRLDPRDPNMAAKARIRTGQSG